MELKFGQACSGRVFVYSQGQRSAVSARNWTQAEGARLCLDLKCGSFLSSSTIKAEEPFWNKSFTCESEPKPRSIWECERPWLDPQEPQEQLTIQCQGNSAPVLRLPS